MADDPVLLITGASSGIGAATARHAAQAGYRVVLAARSQDALDALATELGGEERALAVRCDVTRWEDQEAAVRATLERFGRLDVAFANAGFGAGRSFLASTPEYWEAMVLTNVLGAALTVRATMPALIEARGHLLLTGSVAGRRALPGSLYSCTKWAVTAMGEAADLARQRLQLVLGAGGEHAAVAGLRGVAGGGGADAGRGAGDEEDGLVGAHAERSTGCLPKTGA